MSVPTALAEWRAANKNAIDCRELVHQGERLQCPQCGKWAGMLLALTGKGLRCATCSKKVLGRFTL